VIAITAVSAACTDGPGAERVLRQNGYTNVKLTGWSAFSCSEKDTFATGFEATSPSGQRVVGTVCSGWLKGYTIRFD
jgi:hypothetical protein